MGVYSYTINVRVVMVYSESNIPKIYKVKVKVVRVVCLNSNWFYTICLWLLYIPFDSPDSKLP